MHYRKSIRKTGIVAATIASLVVLGISGCSSPSSSNDGGSATSGNVNWWGWTPAEQVIAKSYISAFNKEYPNIHVTFKQTSISSYPAIVRPALASSTGPDVYEIAPGVPFQQFSHYAADLAPSMEKALGKNWKSKLVASGVDALTDSSGKLKGASIGSVFAGPVWINKELFDKYHVTPPTTIADWVKVCQTFKANGVGCFVHGAQDGGFNRDMIQAISDTIKPGVFYNATIGKAKFTDPVIVQALGVWQSLFSDGIVQPGALGLAQYPDANNAFLSGKYAMIQMGQWYGQYAVSSVMKSAMQSAGVSDPKTFTILPIPFPAAKASGTPGALFGASDYGLAVNAKSKVRNAATTFVTWLSTSKAGQQLVGNALNDVPALKSIKIDWSAAGLVDQAAQQKPIEDLINQTKTTSEGRGLETNADITTAVSAAAQDLAAGKTTPDEAAKAIQSKAK